METSPIENNSQINQQPTPMRSPSIAKLATAFAKAQGKFRTPTMNRIAKIKNAQGALLYENPYADLQECIDCVKGALSENGLAFFQSTQERGGKWFLVLELIHESGETKETVLPLNVNQANQQLGGTLTYLKRYQLSAFFGLAADADDDGNATGNNNAEFEKKGKKPPQTPPPAAQQKPPTQQQKKEAAQKALENAGKKPAPPKLADADTLAIMDDLASSHKVDPNEMIELIKSYGYSTDTIPQWVAQEIVDFLANDGIDSVKIMAQIKSVKERREIAERNKAAVVQNG